MTDINAGKLWSQLELEHLACEMNRGTPMRDIAEQMKRKVIEVQTMAERIIGTSSFASTKSD